MPEQATHPCHALGCPRRVATDRLMCSRHWYMVPLPLRRRVWRAWERFRQDPRVEVFEPRAAQLLPAWVEFRDAREEARQAVLDREEAARV